VLDKPSWHPDPLQHLIVAHAIEIPRVEQVHAGIEGGMSGGHPPYDLKVVAQSGAKVMASAAGLKLSTLPLPLASDPVDTVNGARRAGR
jgi:hypothetical protein